MSKPFVRNRVLLLLLLAALPAVFVLSFVRIAPNRLVSGEGVPLAALAGSAWFAVPGVVLLLAAFAPPARWLHAAVAVASALLLVGLCWLAGGEAARQSATLSSLARVSLGGGFWWLALLSWLAVADALQRARLTPALRTLAHAAALLPVVLLLTGGVFDALSLLKEYANRREVFDAALQRHLQIVMAALLPALALGVPLGVAAARSSAVAGPLLSTLNIIQTVPSIALFALLIAPLGIGLLPAASALVLYALLPIVHGTASGLAQVPSAALEAGTGMGMSARQLFWRVRVPLALPVLLSGLRVTTVQVIGLAVVAALIGAGGFGALVFQGITSSALDLVLLGVVPVVALAVVADAAFALLTLALQRHALPVIELRQVGKSFGATRAVDDVSLAIERGEFVVLIGASGSGKSTLLKMINRLVEHDRGMILFQGEQIRSFEPEDLRRRMGYAIQSIGLFPHWSVARNIATVPELLGWNKARIEARVDELLALLGLEPALYRLRWPHQLSGGQQQRVGVARALAADPEVLLMDEPFGALDPITRASLQQELARIHQASGKTIVLVTHDIEEALRLATRIVLLDRGCVVQDGTPAQLLGAPANDFVGDFFGRAELGLRLLALQRVADRMRAGEPADGAPLADTMSLRDALSQFVVQRAERLPVTDASGRVLGAIRFGDLLGAPRDR